jgi:hypothetical protein
MDTLKLPPGFHDMSNPQKLRYLRGRTGMIVAQAYPNDPAEVERHVWEQPYNSLFGKRRKLHRPA